MKRFLTCIFFVITIGNTYAFGNEDDYPNTFRVFEDHGGHVNEYFDKVAKLNRGNHPIRILGECDSACTIYLSANEVCVTENSNFGFHTAFHTKSYDDWTKVSTDYEATDRIMESYKDTLKNYIMDHGGLNSDFMYIDGKTMILLGYDECQP